MSDFRLVLTLSDCESYCYNARSLNEAYVALMPCIRRYKNFFWKIETKLLTLCPVVVACGTCGHVADSLAEKNKENK